MQPRANRAAAACQGSPGKETGFGFQASLTVRVAALRLSFGTIWRVLQASW